MTMQVVLFTDCLRLHDSKRAFNLWVSVQGTSMCILKSPHMKYLQSREDRKQSKDINSSKNGRTQPRSAVDRS